MAAALPRVAAVEAVCQAHVDELGLVEYALKSGFGIPAGVVRDTIRRRLLMDMAEGRNTIVGGGGWYHRLAPLSILVQAVLSLVFFRSRTGGTCDILFDCWWAGVNRVYLPIIRRLGERRRCAAVSRDDPMGAEDKLPYAWVAERSGQRWWNRRIAWAILGNVVRWGLRVVPAGDRSLNLGFLYAVLLRKIGRFATEVDDISARIVFSFGDPYYSAMRTHFYRSTGGRVVLLQNGLVGGATADSFIHCDDYLVWGEVTAELIPGLACGRMIGVGSVKAAEAMVGTVAEPDVRWDMCFIDQNCPFDVSDTWYVDSFLSVVDNVAHWARDNPDRRLIFATRPLRRSLSDRSALIDAIDAKFAGLENVTYSCDADLDSYQAVMASRLVVTYTSAMGVEAIGMDKDVIFCNSDGFRFLPPELSLVEGDYQAFRRRVDALLGEGGTDTAEKAHMKRRYMDVAHDGFGMIANLLDDALASPIPR